MNETNENNAQPGEHKRAYSKPKLQRVELRSEEAVLALCKTSSSSGPLQTTCGFPTKCSSAGS